MLHFLDERNIADGMKAASFRTGRVSWFITQCRPKVRVLTVEEGSTSVVGESERGKDWLHSHSMKAQGGLFTWKWRGSLKDGCLLS